MSDQERLEELLLDWEEHYEQGRDVPAAELARDYPNLIAALERDIAKLKAVRCLSDPPTLVHPSTLAEGRLPAFAGCRYRPLRFHAAGGLGEVFVARDVELGRDVALKRIQGLAAHRADSRQRFLAEAEITARLEHPGIVPVYGLNQDASGQPFYAMRFIQGTSLRDAIAQCHARQAASGTELRSLLQRFIAVCNAVAYAHSRGAVHRDLKPANVMLGKFGETLVVDWGLAKVVGNPDGTSRSNEDALPLPSGGEDDRTLQGEAMGTPAYMSPEQANGRWAEVGPASDVFSLGATLFHIMTNRPPYAGSRTLEAARQGRFERPRKLAPGLSPALEAVCLKAMAAVPADRYATASDLAQDVERYLADEPVSARREPLPERAWRWVRRNRVLVAAALVLVGVAVGIVYVLGVQKARDLAEEQHGIAEGQRRRAEESEGRATEQRNVAEQQKALYRRSQYLAQMGLAQRLWDEGGAARTIDQLEAIRDREGDLRGFEWHYLHRLTRSQFVLGGCTNNLLDVAFNADGTRLAAACWDGKVHVWDATTGREIFALKGSSEMVCCVAFSPDGQRLVAGVGNRVQVWDAATGEERPGLPGSGGSVYAVSFSPDGKRLALAGSGKAVLVCNAATGEKLQTLATPNDDLYRVVFSADGKSLAAAGSRAAVVWEAATGVQRFQLDAERGTMQSVDFSPDGRLLATAVNRYDENSRTTQGTVQVLDATTGGHLHTYPARACEINRVAFSPDGKRLAFAGDNEAITVWTPGSKEDVLTLKGHSPQPSRMYLAPSKPGVNGLAFNPDGRHLASAADDRTVRLWDVTPTDGFDPAGFGDDLVSAGFSADGQRLATVSGKGTVRVHDVLSGREVRKLDSDPIGQDVRCAVLSPDGQRLATASKAGAVTLRDVATGKELHTLPGSGEVSFRPDGQRLATAAGPVVKVWDVETGQLLRTIGKQEEKPGFELTAVAYSADGRTIAAAGKDPDYRAIHVWDAETGEELRTLGGHGWGIEALVFSGDGKYLASASTDNTVILWQTSDGERCRTFRGHTGTPGAVHCLAFSPDSTRLITGGDDRTVRLWDIATGQEIMTLRGHRAPVQSVTFTPDGQRVFSLGGGALRVWDGRRVGN